MNDKTFSAIVLAAGSGRRMGSAVPKQYLEILGKPLLYYTLRAFEQSDVDEVILVASADYLDWCRSELTEKYAFTKVKAIVAGGAERTDSVGCGLKAAHGDYVLVHDGARCLVTPEIIRRAMDAAVSHDAAVIGMPVKDTIKQTAPDAAILATPDRKTLWAAQTPQAFAAHLLREAYAKKEASEDGTPSGWTDDADFVYSMIGKNAVMIEGSYDNIKVTTPEDLIYAECMLKNR